MYVYEYLYMIKHVYTYLYIFMHDKFFIEILFEMHIRFVILEICYNVTYMIKILMMKIILKFGLIFR